METHQHELTDTAASSCPEEGLGSARFMRSVRFWAALLVLSAVPSVSSASDEVGATGPAGELPSFVFDPLYADNEGSVYGVYEARQADLVLVKGGFDSGFRQGMVCKVSKGAAQIGEVLLVNVRNNCSAALILDLEPETTIEPGQSVRIKTVNF